MKKKKFLTSGVVILFVVLFSLFIIYLNKWDDKRSNCLEIKAREICNEYNLTFNSLGTDLLNDFILCNNPKYDERMRNGDRYIKLYFKDEEIIGCEN